MISSVTEPFCRDCHRARLSADGKLYTCLFASLGWDVLGALRAGADDAELGSVSRARLAADGSTATATNAPSFSPAAKSRAKIEMSYIGG